jgi:hypothetical protein
MLKFPRSATPQRHGDVSTIPNHWSNRSADCEAEKSAVKDTTRMKNVKYMA